MSSEPSPSLSDAERHERDRPLSRTDRYFPVLGALAPGGASVIAGGGAKGRAQGGNSSSGTQGQVLPDRRQETDAPASISEMVSVAVQQARDLGSGSPDSWLEASLQLLGFGRHGHTADERSAALEVQ